MSFIDMMASHVWSDADITNRTEAMLRSQFSVVDEQVLNRKVTGAAMGIYTLTQDDEIEVQAFAAATLASQQAGQEARADMANLLQVFDVEAAERRLAQAPVEPVLDEEGNVTNQDAVDEDAAQRAQAQATVDGASAEVLEWVAKRRPPPPEPAPEPEPEPQTEQNNLEP